MGVILSGKHAKPTLSTELMDGPLENLSGEGGWGGRSTKKYSRTGKLNEKKLLHAN